MRGTAVPPNMVRIGSFDYEPTPIVRSYSLDHFVDIELKKNKQIVDHAKIEANCKSMDELDKNMFNLDLAIKDATGTDKSKATMVLDSMRKRKRDILIETNNLRQMKKTAAINSNLLENEILSNTKIILTTLSMSGIEMLDKMCINFSHLIVDEACQASEISTLIPFMQRVQKAVLVGDHNQLPATVFSPNAWETGYNRSMYERFLANQIPRFVLKIQYRMHPSIREFPSNEFYDGELVDADKVIARKVDDKDGIIPRLMFYNLEYTTENKSTGRDKSKSNTMEAHFVAKIFIEAVILKGKGDFVQGLLKSRDDIGIITPYK